MTRKEFFATVAGAAGALFGVKAAVAEPERHLHHMPDRDGCGGLKQWQVPGDLLGYDRGADVTLLHFWDPADRSGHSVRIDTRRAQGILRYHRDHPYGAAVYDSFAPPRSVINCRSGEEPQ